MSHAKPIIELAAHVLRRARRNRGAKPPVIFITGTDTGIGKTSLACALVEELRARGVHAVGFKPICCGDRDDGRRLTKCSGGKFSMETINPIHLPEAVAPIAQKSPSWPSMRKLMSGALKEFARGDVEIIVAEGAGGLLCPVARGRTMRDIAMFLGAQVLLVAPNRLGVLNQVLMVVEAAKARDLRVAALVLHGLGKKGDASTQSNARLLVKWTRIPIWTVFG